MRSITNIYSLVATDWRYGDSLDWAVLAHCVRVRSVRCCSSLARDLAVLAGDLVALAGDLVALAGDLVALHSWRFSGFSWRFRGLS